jgi:GNAT superfamily N-acetyltransferase
VAITIVDLNREPGEWAAFCNLPATVYSDDPYYLASAPERLKDEIFRTSAEQLILLARRDGQAVARVCARIVDNLVEGQPIGVLGFFEARSDYEAVAGMLDQAVEWLRDRGIARVIGPMNGDTWHKYRFNVGPFDRPPFLMEPYNPPHYAELWQRYGFQVLAEYNSKHVPDVEAILPTMKRYYDRSIGQGMTYRPFNLKRYDDELRLFYELSCEIFAGNPFYKSISFDEFKELYIDSRTIIHENHVWFCRDKNGEYAGFVFSFPDYFAAVQKMDGRRNLWAKVKFVLNRGKADTLNIKTVGAVPAHRGRGLGSALMYKAYQEGFNAGLKKANMCLFHEDNASASLDGGKGERLRTYQLYELSINE